MVKTKTARDDLPKHHPQNTPLSQWPDGWLKMSCSDEKVLYIIMHDHEKREKGLPVTREEMIAYLIERGEIPAAGV